jgi:hypothetical protein
MPRTQSPVPASISRRAPDPGHGGVRSPLPDKTIADPACGTGGFFLAAYDFLVDTYPGMDKTQRAFLKHDTFFGNEIVAGTRRLALMNMFLHNIGEIDGDSCVSPNDALVGAPSRLSITSWPTRPSARRAA